jgi:hypothetical protein
MAPLPTLWGYYVRILQTFYLKTADEIRYIVSFVIDLMTKYKQVDLNISEVTDLVF